jgi:hypothetical protein
LIGADKNGGYNAVNAGDCATAFNPNDLAITGIMAPESAFIVTCVNTDSKPISLGIAAPGISGQVRAAKAILNQFVNQVPKC